MSPKRELGFFEVAIGILFLVAIAFPPSCTSESRGDGATAFDGELCARTGVVYLRLPEGIAPLYERDGSLVTCVP